MLPRACARGGVYGVARGGGLVLPVATGFLPVVIDAERCTGRKPVPTWAGRRGRSVAPLAAGFLPALQPGTCCSSTGRKPVPTWAARMVRAGPVGCGQGPWVAASYPDTASSQSANFGYVRSRSNSAAARRRRRRCRPRPPHARQSAAAARPEVSSRSNRPSD